MILGLGAGAACAIVVAVGAPQSARARTTHECVGARVCASAARQPVPRVCSARACRAVPRFCVWYRCRTVAGDEVAEVLFVTKRHPAGRFPECRQVVVGEFARWRSSGRLTPLVSGTDYGEGSPLVEEEGVCRPDALMSLAGRYVAYARPFCTRRVCVPGGGGGGAGEASYLVARVDAKTGERLRTGLRPFVDDVVVTDGGAVAWIQSPREGKGFEVLSAKDSSSFAQPTVLAAESVRGESLAVAQETIYWTEEGQPQSAEL